MKQFSILLLACSFLSYSGTAQLGNYNQNGEVKILSQKTWAAITTKEVEVKSDKEAAGAIAGAILSPLIDVGIAVAKEKLKQNAAKFSSSFIVTVSGSGFWITDKKVKLPIITINRKVLKKDDHKEASAMVITLEPELSPDKTAFRFKVANSPFTFTYSSAKTKKEYDFIDIKLDIKFKALLVTKSQYELKDLRATSITIPMVEAGNAKLPDDVTLTSGWMPLPAIPTLEIETDVTDQETKIVAQNGTKEGKPINETLTTVTTTQKPKATDKKRLTEDAGLYEFEITVTETNPYKVKSENTQHLVESTGDSSAAFLKAIVDSIFKKEESKEEESKEE